MKLTHPNSPTLDLSLPGALAFTTQRNAADPADPYSGFNACFYSGGDPKDVAAAHALAARALGLDDPSRLILPRQTHSTNVATVDLSTAGHILEDIDALVTADPRIALGINTADCVPILLSDPRRGIVAAIHSGWRGTVARIAAKAVEKMVSLGSAPADIHAALGPHICTECFEVGPEVADRFIQEFGAESLTAIAREEWARPRVDLRRAIEITLTDVGLPAGHISPAPACSRCNPTLFFSARAIGTASGRTLTAIRIHAERPGSTAQ